MTSRFASVSEEGILNINEEGTLQAQRKQQNLLFQCLMVSFYSFFFFCFGGKFSARAWDRLRKTCFYQDLKIFLKQIILKSAIYLLA